MLKTIRESAPPSDVEKPEAKKARPPKQPKAKAGTGEVKAKRTRKTRSDKGSSRDPVRQAYEVLFKVYKEYLDTLLMVEGKQNRLWEKLDRHWTGIEDVLANADKDRFLRLLHTFRKNASNANG